VAFRHEGEQHNMLAAAGMVACCGTVGGGGHGRAFVCGGVVS
jgi:hypothetical protein